MLSGKNDRLRDTSTPAGRNVIVHYHLFKNAGTSIDKILRENFGKQRWRKAEFSGPTTNIPAVLSGNSSAPQVQEWLARHPEVVALSSHTAAMPLPDLPATRVFPIVMVRNPIIRLQSSYLFQRKRFAAGFDRKTTRLAGENDLAGYLRGLLAMRQQSLAHNFASVRLAAAVEGSPERIRQRAFEAFELLPFVGVVERFEQSMQVLERWLAPHFPGFRARPAWRNAADAAGVPLAERLDGMRAEIGNGLYDRLVAANRVDLELHEAASRKIDAMAKSPPRVSSAAKR